MSAHAPVLGHRARPDAHEAACVTCGRAVVYVEDTTTVSPHWRHKPEGYRWGDVAGYWRRRALAAEAELERRTA